MENINYCFTNEFMGKLIKSFIAVIGISFIIRLDSEAALIPKRKIKLSISECLALLILNR